MNVCTFVGEIAELTIQSDSTEINIKVAEYYTNSRGEKKVDYNLVPCVAYSTAGEYIKRNAKRGDNIAVRAMYVGDNYYDYVFRINEFKIIKD